MSILVEIFENLDLVKIVENLNFGQSFRKSSILFKIIEIM